MYFSKRMDLDSNGITAEIAELDYSIEFKSGVKLHLKEGDLVTFIRKYIPEVKIDDYFEASFKVFQHSQNVDLLYFVRHKLHDAMKKHFFEDMYAMELDGSETDTYYYDSFNDMKSQDNCAEFLACCKNAYDEVKNGSREKITAKLDLHSSAWRFYNDDMRFDDEELSIVVNEKALMEITDHIRKDFEENGQKTLDGLVKKDIKNNNNYISVDFFIKNFNQDLSEFEEDFTYEKFANFLNKYKLVG
jgi:hypothetical protein